VIGAGEQEARELDRADPGHRDLFDVPTADGGGYREVAYFAGNSLGLRPKATRIELLEDLDSWAALGARPTAPAPARPRLSSRSPV
jgi:kynureninase